MLHEYILDKNALFAAASMGLTSELVLQTLNKLSKSSIHRAVERFVRLCTTGYGKVKLVLERSRYYVESSYPSVLRLLASHPGIAAARVHRSASGAVVSAGHGQADGFTTSSARDEAKESLGLTGIVQSGSSAGAASGRDRFVDTAGGLLSTFVSGEAADDTAAAPQEVRHSDDDSDGSSDAAGMSKAEEEEYLAAIFSQQEQLQAQGWSTAGAHARRHTRQKGAKVDRKQVQLALNAINRLKTGAPAPSAAALQQSGAAADDHHSSSGAGETPVSDVGAFEVQQHVSKRGRRVRLQGKQQLEGLDLESSEEEEDGEGGDDEEDEDVTFQPQAAEVSGPAVDAGAEATMDSEEEEFVQLVDEEGEDDEDDEELDCDADYDDDLAVDDGRQDAEVLAEARKASKKKARLAKGVAAGRVSAMDMLLALPQDAQDHWRALQREAAVSASKPLKGRAARQVLRFEINANTVEEIRRIALSLDPPYPMMHEYDFRADSLGVAPLDMSLRNPELLRPYQAKSLAKMYGNGRARSGIIVLPCGAGKTLVGIAAACTMKKSVLVFCPNSTSVDQWVQQFRHFSTIEPKRLIKLTAKNKQQLPPPSEGCVVLTTYHMIAAGGQRAVATQALLKSIEEREWGLALLDEVHQAVADKFSRVLRLRCHCRLGLTATLVREDDRDKELSYMVGPKLYEANWMDLTKQGYLANVQVIEVWCPMTRDFYREYLSHEVAAQRTALSIMNPTKCFVLHRLLEEHASRRGDKIIVFSESVYALQLYAEMFKAPCISGSTPELKRKEYIHAFRSANSGCNVLFLTRVGDVALDVPDANVIIQIASHFGSRLQEAQRLGRILRKGRNYHASSQFNAFFYTLISTDTKEVYFSAKRRRYLVDQGYAYKVVPAVADGDKGLAPSIEKLREGCPYMHTQAQQDRELQKILTEDIGGADEAEARALDAMASGTTSFVDELKAADRLAAAGKARAAALGGVLQPAAASARRTIGSIHSWSMAGKTQYMEYASDTRLEALRVAEEEAAKARSIALKQAVGSVGKVKPV